MIIGLMIYHRMGSGTVEIPAAGAAGMVVIAHGCVTSFHAIHAIHAIHWRATDGCDGSDGRHGTAVRRLRDGRHGRRSRVALFAAFVAACRCQRRQGRADGAAIVADVDPHSVLVLNVLHQHPRSTESTLARPAHVRRRFCNNIKKKSFINSFIQYFFFR